MHAQTHQPSKQPFLPKRASAHHPAQPVQVTNIIARQSLQAKLKVGASNDHFEQEADRVADRVMRMPDPAAARSNVETTNNAVTIQRKCSACEDQALQRKPEGSHRDTPSSGLDSVASTLRQSGRPLDAGTRHYFEPRFGADFSNVRIHTDTNAAASARSVNALAYTVGRDVVFNSGQYAPHRDAGKRLLAHELTHVVQQSGGRQAGGFTNARTHTRQVDPSVSVGPPMLQRDLARPPGGVPDPVVQLTAQQIQDAIAFNQTRFNDPYSIRVIRDVVGLNPVPAVVDEDLIQFIVEWQAERRQTQDGKIGHVTTRSLYLELVAESMFRDAILLLMDSYRLPEDMRLNDIRIGTGVNCCGPAGGADAVTFGGPHCPPVGGPVNICFCRTAIPQGVAGYDHFVRIVGHELIHVPQCAAGTGNVDVDEFEAFFFEACAQGRLPQLVAGDRVDHANIALGHFALIPAALRTAPRIVMRDQLNTLVAAGGVGAC